MARNVLWRDAEAIELEDSVRATGSVGVQMRHKEKGDRLHVCSTANNELFLLGLLQVRSVVGRSRERHAECRNLSGIFGRIPLGERKWQLRFVNTESDRLSRDVSIASQVQTNRFLTDRSADLLAGVLGGGVVETGRELRFEEGERRVVQSIRAVRSPALRAEAKRCHGYRCFCCGFHFGEFYGPIAEGVGLVQHIDPLGAGGVRETTVDRVRVVCANCHSVLHLTERTSPRNGQTRDTMSLPPDLAVTLALHHRLAAHGPPYSTPRVADLRRHLLHYL